MSVDVAEDPQPDLAAYAQISIAYEVQEVFDISSDPASGNRLVLTARAVGMPYVKDYDADGGGPETWASRFDLSSWRIFVARVDGRRVGGAAVVVGASDVDMLHGDDDLALLWDIRVSPEARGAGVGTALVAAAEAWAVANGALRMEVETQNVNVPACRFYERRGFRLREVNAGAYATLPTEVQLLWRKSLA